MVVMSHEMIFHHHHDDFALNFSVTYEADIEHEHKHSHNKENQHNNNSQQEEKNSEHSHPFPFHKHILATNDVYIERTKLLESNTHISNVLFLVFTELFRTELCKPPNLEGKLYEEPPFLISSLCKLEAFALRGPPAIV